jgi:hypothetical protein
MMTQILESQMNGTSKYICRVEDGVSNWHILVLCLLALAVVSNEWNE